MLKKYSGVGGAVVIPEGVHTIGEFTFENCESLISVHFSNKVKKSKLLLFRVVRILFLQYCLKASLLLEKVHSKIVKALHLFLFLILLENLGIVLFLAVKNLPFKLLQDVVRNDMPKKTKLNMRRFESFEI